MEFDTIWREHIVPLQGRTLRSSRGENQILRVDDSGVLRVSSQGGQSRIGIETFRSVWDRLLAGKTVTRQEIHEMDPSRVSSGVCLILTQVPGITYDGRPARLRLDRERLGGSEAMDLFQQALAGLSPPGRAIDDPQLLSADGPGLYAIYGSPDVWVELGLGSPPDHRPLYVGKAEHSLKSRDVKQHFGTGSTGSSTVRRSLAALLREPLQLKAQPRNISNPDHFANYSVAREGDERLTRWMHQNLRLALWIRPGDASLTELERMVLRHWLPPLNGKEVKTPWTAFVSGARKAMAQEARGWRA